MESSFRAFLSEPALLFLSALVAVACASIAHLHFKRRHLPPGPPGLPLIGNWPTVGRHFYFQDCIRWALKYGPVVRIQVGATNIIVLMDQESIEKYLSKKEILNRASQWVAQNKTNGIGSINGDDWQENRRLVIRIMADLGIGKESMHSHIQEEVQRFVAKISELGGTPLPFRHLLSASVLNNILYYLLGTTYDLDDPKLERMARLVAAFSGVGLDFSIEHLPAWVRRLCQWLSLRGSRSAISSSIEEFKDYMRKEVNIYRNTTRTEERTCFIDSFLRGAENRNEGDDSVPDSRLTGNICDLMVASTATTTTVLQWHLLHLASDPDGLQTLLQQEIAAVVGHERPPSWQDRALMPLTMATIWEMYRCKPPTPFGIPREAAEDTHFGKYFIAKGSVILPNFWLAHRNCSHWEKPYEFNPRRFLKPDSSAQVTRPNGLLAFSVGKRMCAGESMGNSEVFLYVTSLLQKFRILLEEGCSFDINKTGIPASEVAGIKLRFIPR